MPAIGDTSFVIAVSNRADRRHQVCTEIYRREEEVFLPQAALAEVAYMLRRELGNRAVASFLRQLPESKYRVIVLDAPDFLRTAEILEKYVDARIDFVDATIITLAERLRIRRILTLDQRDFHIVRPSHAAYFEILPQQIP